ncbi:MAG: hypothetical protein ACRDJN_24765 [Chloroflexota bacterium]
MGARRAAVSLLAVLLSASLGGGGAAHAQAAPETIARPNLEVTTATYLGGAGAQAAAVDVAPDGGVIFGGVWPRARATGGDPSTGHLAGQMADSGYASGLETVSLLGGGDGVVVRVAAGPPSGMGSATPTPATPHGAEAVGVTAPTAPVVLSVTRIGASVDDLKVNAGGAIAACGDFGVAVLDPTASAVLWADDPGPVRRCAFGDDGTVAALAGHSVYVYGSGGGMLGNWSAGVSHHNDVAIDSGRNAVITTGYTNRRTARGLRVQVAFLRAWSYSGVLRWSNYDVPADQLWPLVADTRGVRVSMGRDGKLYFAGESAGGDSIFSRSPAEPGAGAALSDEQLARTDAFTIPYNTRSNHITWFGRYDPADGTLERGQFLLARLDSGDRRGNTIRPRAIMADETGRVYLAGVTTSSIHNRDDQSIAGTQVGPYTGSEAFVLVVQPDFRERVVWTPFTAPIPAGADPTHDSAATGIGLRDGVVAVAATLNRGALLTYNPLPGIVSLDEAAREASPSLLATATPDVPHVPTPYAPNAPNAPTPTIAAIAATPTERAAATPTIPATPEATATMLTTPTAREVTATTPPTPILPEVTATATAPATSEVLPMWGMLATATPEALPTRAYLAIWPQAGT